MDTRINRIKELFIKLKLGHGWYVRHENDLTGVNELFRRSEPIFEELETLSVSRNFSESLLIFGPLITNELLRQFEQKDLTLGKQSHYNVEDSRTQ